MTKLRALVKGDRVKIIGPWCLDTGEDGGRHHIGKSASVVEVTDHPTMPVNINIDGDVDTLNPWHWCRENLRALPRNWYARQH